MSDLKAKDLRDAASSIREKVAEVEGTKTIKCAKYIVGLTSLIKLRNILRGN